MSELGSTLASPELAETVAHFSSFLLEHQIQVPESPLDDTTNIIAPREWLLRGESNKARLLNSPNSPFTPQGGEWGTGGVFFGDCLKPLSYPSRGAWYIYRTGDISTQWLVTPSEQFATELENIAEKKQLNLTSITGGIEAESEVYKHYNVYQARKGVATLSHSLPIEQAHAIIVTKDFLQADDLAHLPSSLKDKLITFV